MATEEDEMLRAQDLKGIEAAWAGGKHGIEILEKFLPQARERLTD